MNLLIWPILAMLLTSALLEVWRMAKGPTALDRTLAADAIVATLVCALGVEAVVRDHSTTLPVLVSLSMIGFVATVAVSRFVTTDNGNDEPLGPGDARDDDTAEQAGDPR